MTATAAVLLVKTPGHVLATVTLVGDPAATPSVAALAGTAFPVRDPATGQVMVEVPAEELDTQVVPLIDDLLIEPQACAVADGAATVLTAAGGAATVTIAATGVTVKIPNPAPDKTPVWVQVDSGGGSARKHEVLSGEIAQNATEADFAHTFSAGDYDLLALVAGYPPVLAPAQSVP
jgi:hypothetical protein